VKYRRLGDWQEADDLKRGGSAILSCKFCGEVLASVGGGTDVICEVCWRKVEDGYWQMLKHTLESWKRLLLDKPEDRLYHASDRTWWRRAYEKEAADGLGPPWLVRADAPPIVNDLVEALDQAAEVSYLEGKLMVQPAEPDALDAEYGPKWLKRYERAWKKLTAFIKKYGRERSDEN
jgi:hypothetical protein